MAGKRESDGLVIRRSYDVVLLHADYTLTPLGLEAAENAADLADWIEERLPRTMAKHRGCAGPSRSP